MRCTAIRVAAHTLYENESPYYLKEPAGTLDTTGARYEQVSERAVKVSGSRFIPAEHYTVKLEGAEPAGFRSIAMVGVRDPQLISQIDSYLARVKQMVGDRKLALLEDYMIYFRVYGKNAVMGRLEPEQERVGHEIGILIDVVGKSQEIATAVLALTRTFMQVSDFEGRLCTAGNIAYPFSPNGIDVGPSYKFSMCHVVEPDDPYEMFPIEIVTV
jgi:hypothetical protein